MSLTYGLNVFLSNHGSNTLTYYTLKSINKQTTLPMSTHHLGILW